MCTHVQLQIYKHVMFLFEVALLKSTYYTVLTYKSCVEMSKFSNSKTIYCRICKYCRWGHIVGGIATQCNIALVFITPKKLSAKVSSLNNLTSRIERVKSAFFCCVHLCIPLPLLSILPRR